MTRIQIVNSLKMERELLADADAILLAIKNSKHLYFQKEKMEAAEKLKADILAHIERMEAAIAEA